MTLSRRHHALPLLLGSLLLSGVLHAQQAAAPPAAHDRIALLDSVGPLISTIVFSAK